MDLEAHAKFQELLKMLEQGLTKDVFQGIREQMQGMRPEDMDELREMLRSLNRMLREREMGLEPRFDEFMERFGQHFDPDRPTSMDELLDRLRQRMEAMQSLMDGMTPEMLSELDSLMKSALDGDTMSELAELAGHMGLASPLDDPGSALRLLGDESMARELAMDSLGRLDDLDELERQLPGAFASGDIASIDPGTLEEHLGEEARRQLERLQQVVRQLQEAGYLRREGQRLELTPRAIRKLAQQALKKDRTGRHEVYHRGDGGENVWETKKFEFGDPFDIDLHRTVHNAVLRQGPGVPVRLHPDDLEVQRTEHLTQAATVLLLDQNRSMGMFGSFAAAEKVALALYWLIRSRYPSDYFSVIGFSDYAIEIKGEDLAGVTWNDWVSGTNMHLAFMLSRRILSRQKVATKQILMITDGEPTAHMEDGYPYFSYPPTPQTIRETLKEVKRCTQAGITINTFMLTSTDYLVDFVDRMTRINRGRAFYSTPTQLGRYVMVDYLRNRRKRVA